MKTMSRGLTIFFFFAAVLYGQNALAIATGGSTAYFDWGTYQITNSGGGTVSYVPGTQDSWFQNSYTIPNSSKVTTPWHGTGSWVDDKSTKQNNPAGPTIAYSVATTPINDINNEAPPWPTENFSDLNINDPSAGQGLFAKAYAQVDSSSFGDSVVDEYSASATAQREGQFTVDVTGTYTFSVEYNLLQVLLIEDYLTDKASALSTFRFLGGYVDGGGNLIETDNSGGYTHALVYDPIEPYWQDFSTTGTLSFSMDLLAGDTYWMQAWAINDVSAASDDVQNPHPGTVPEPATVLLVGSGLAGLAVSRRRKAKSIS